MSLKLKSGVASTLISPGCPSKLTSITTWLCLELQDSIGSTSGFSCGGCYVLMLEVLGKVQKGLYVLGGGE